MGKKRLLILFIISFLCIIDTVNHLCFKYFDNPLNSLLIERFHLIQVSNYANLNFVSENYSLVLTLSIACLFFIVYICLEKIPACILTIAFSIFYIWGYKALVEHNVVINLISVFIAILFAKAFSVTYYHIFKQNMDKKIENLLSKYVSSDIKNKLLKNDVNAELGGKRIDVTVMFADIRGFTSLSEKRKAEDVSSLLIEYFSELEPIINKYGGVINKFIGDAVLVIFGDPVQNKYHAKSAVKCAYALRKKVKEIRDRWITEGKPKIDIGIGLNSGEAFIGNIGTANRFEYTAIGDTVNIASRIEDYNKIYKTHVLISENTYNRISEIVDVIKIREVYIKGKSNKINIYEVLRIIDSEE